MTTEYEQQLLEENIKLKEKLQAVRNSVESKKVQLETKKRSAKTPIRNDVESKPLSTNTILVNNQTYDDIMKFAAWEDMSNDKNK